MKSLVSYHYVFLILKQPFVTGLLRSEKSYEAVIASWKADRDIVY